MDLSGKDNAKPNKNAGTRQAGKPGHYEKIKSTNNRIRGREETRVKVTKLFFNKIIEENPPNLK